MFYEPTEHSVGIRQIAAGWLICGFLLAGILGLVDRHRGDHLAGALHAAAVPNGGVAEVPGIPC
jgi:hypothetical protein